MTPQRMAALEVANEIRMTRAAVRRAVVALPIVEGRREVARLIRANEPVWHTATLGYMLRMPFRTGEATARKWMRAVDLHPARKLGGLSDRQRDELARQIEKTTLRNDQVWKEAA